MRGWQPRSLPLGYRRSFWGHLGVILGSFWDHFGIILGSFWDGFGMVWGWFWDGLGMVWGWFWDGFGIVLGSFWDDFVQDSGRSVKLNLGWVGVGGGSGDLTGVGAGINGCDGCINGVQQTW